MATGRLLRMRPAAAILAASFVVVACAPATPPPEASDPLGEASIRSTLPSNVGPADCDPPSPATETDLGLEVEGATHASEVWALFADPPVRAGHAHTVWWRIAGKNALNLVLVGSGGREEIVDDERPDPSLAWERPGDQWVSTIVFPQAGCWRVSATRGPMHGDVWIRVS